MTPAEERYWLLTRAKGEPDPAKRQAMLAGAALQQLERMADAAGRLPNEVYGLKVEVADGFAHTQALLRDMLATVEEGRRQHLAGLALQQEMLRRDDFQAGAEQLIFELAKAVQVAENPPPGTDPTVLLFGLESRLDAIDAVPLTTPLVRGLDNKRAFEEAVAAARRHRNALRQLGEVQEALRWANDQQRVLEEAEERERRAEEQRREVEARRREELKEEEERLRRRRAEVKKNPPKFKHAGSPEVPFSRWLRTYRLSVVLLLLFAPVTCCCPGSLIGVLPSAAGEAIFGIGNSPPAFTAVGSVGMLACAALPLLVAGAYWRGDGGRESAQVRRAMQEILDELDIITVNVGDGDPDAPDYRLVLAVAEGVAYGRGAGEPQDAPPKLTAVQEDALVRLVSAQPWAVLKPSTVSKRGLNTSEGVRDSVATAAKRFEQGRPNVLNSTMYSVGCLSAVLFVCGGILFGIAKSKVPSSPSTTSQPTSPDTRAVVEPTAKKVEPTP